MTSTPQTPLPDGWRMVRLGDVAHIHGGTGFPLERQGRIDGDYPFIKVSDMNVVGNERTITAAANYVDEDDVADLGAHVFSPETIVFPKVGAAISTNKKRVLMVPTIIDNNMMGLTARPERQCNSRYLHNWIESLDLDTVANVSAVPSITASRLKSQLIPLPPPEEQRGIAAVLDSIDEAIEWEEAVVSATEQLRDAMLHELLTRGIPGRHTEWQNVPGLGTIPVSWDVAKLGDVGRWLSGGTPSKARPDYWSGELPWVSPKDMKSRLISDTVDHVSMEGAHAGSRIAGEGAILVVVRGMILAHSFPVGVLDVAAAFNQDIRALECADNFNSKYVLAALHAQKSRLQNLPTPSTHGTMRVTSEELFSVPIPLPPLLEQEQIADILDGIEASTAESRTQTEVLRSLKASAAEALLTGKVRVRGK